jgi:hypothetical protein
MNRFIQKLTLPVKLTVLSFLMIVSFFSNANAEDIVLLSAGATWKKQYVFFPPKVSVKSAKAANLPTDPASRAKLLSKRIKSGFKTEMLKPDWMHSKFDDTEWHSDFGPNFSKRGWGIKSRDSLSLGLEYTRGTDIFVSEIGLMALRGKFIVKDVTKVKKLSLDITYRGGIVVYLNGKEIVRKSLPVGKLKFDTAADDYPTEAFWIRKKGRNTPLLSIPTYF